jgi:predicted metal-dependent enzyme (double-stranded beta helix superfamily)
MHTRLAPFIRQVEAALASSLDEAPLLARVQDAMRALVAVDDWLPESQARPDPTRYQQHLLHSDPGGRFSVVSFVWGPGQATPIHDHTVWGVIGMLRGAERAQHYQATPQGLREHGPAQTLHPGEVTAVSPRIGDIHRVSNAHADRVSISIHAYGGEIGHIRRHVFDPATGATKDFVSGYANAPGGRP